MRNIFDTILTMLLLFLGQPVAAVSKNAIPSFLQVTQEQGLAGLTATDFCMDKDGQMWISTSRGLSLYNGQFVTSFKMPDTSVKFAHLYHLDVNERGDVYACGKGGLFVLPFGENEVKRILDHTVLNVKVKGDDVYYGDKEGLHLLDVKGRSKALFQCTLEDLSVRSIRIVGDKIWFTVSRRLGCYDVKTGKVFLVHVLSSSSLTDFDVYGNKIFLGTTSDGLLCYDIVSRKVRRVSSVLGWIVNSVKVSGRSVCIGTDGFGGYLLDAKTEQVKEEFSTFEEGSHRLPDNALYSFLRDKHGTDWFGIYCQGAVCSSYTNPIFSLYSNKDFTTNDISIRCFFQDGENFFLGTRSGLYFRSVMQGKTTLYLPKKYGANIITDVAKVGGKYYVSTYDCGLFMLDPETGSFTHVQGHKFFQNSTFYRLCNAPDGTLWCTGSEGVFVIKPTGEVRLILVQDKKIRRMPMMGIVFDHQGRAWVGTNIGIILIDTKSYKIQNYNADMKAFQNTSDYNLMEGHNGRIVAYSNDSVKVYDVNTLQHQDMALPSMVTGERCTAFFDDGKGYYFVATENGLFRMNYLMDNILRLGYAENFNANMVTQIKGNSNNLWFCTDLGLYHLQNGALDKGLERHARFQIVPYHLQLGGYPVGMGVEREVLKSKRISVGWNFVQTGISFIPVFEDYARSDDRVYEYRIADGEWTIAKGQCIDVVGLSPGRHQLTVRLLGKPSTETVYTIWVIPSVWFWIEILIILVVIVVAFYFRSYRKKTNTLLDERNIIEEALMEVEQVQNETQDKLEQTVAESKKTVKINRDEMEKLFARVDKFMKGEKPYLKPDMRLSDLSTAMGVSNTSLSNMFKYYLEESYYDYVNSYRLKEFKRYLEAKAYKQYTIMALSEKCGFKKSSFFTTFRKIEGMTPTEYLQKHT